MPREMQLIGNSYINKSTFSIFFDKKEENILTLQKNELYLQPQNERRLFS